MAVGVPSAGRRHGHQSIYTWHLVGNKMDAMNWSAQQGHILTGGGRLEKLYNAPDFVWTEDQLPHYHKTRHDTHEVFAKWKAEGKTSNLVAGAWSRPLFVGGWQHTGDHIETVFNVQVSLSPPHSPLILPLPLLLLLPMLIIVHT